MKRTICYSLLLSLVALLSTSCCNCMMYLSHPNEMFVFTNGNVVEATYFTSRGVEDKDPCVQETVTLDSTAFIIIESMLRRVDNDNEENYLIHLKHIEGNTPFYALTSPYITINEEENISLWELPTEKYSCKEIIDSIISQCPENIYTISKMITVPGRASSASNNNREIELTINK